MPLGRSGSCDQRRRRVLIDESLHQSEDRDASGIDDGQPETIRLPGRRYPEAASAEQHSPLTALIARKASTLVLLLLAGLALIAGIEALYHHAVIQGVDSVLGQLPACNVQAAGGLASWCSSILLLAAAFQGIQIYRLRRHRTDDYGGKYRVWAWISPLIFLMALAAGTHLHHDLISVAMDRFGAGSAVRPQLVQAGAPLLVWLLVATRLSFEIRESRASLVGLIVATVGFAVAAVLQVLNLSASEQANPILIASSAAMIGHLATFLAVATYGRYVYLDAQGLTNAEKKTAKPRSKKAKATKKTPETKTSTAAGKKNVLSIDEARKAEADTKTESSPASPAAKQSAPSEPPALKNSPAADDPSDSDESDKDDGGPRLSKAERRRLRKMKRREQSRKAA